MPDGLVPFMNPNNDFDVEAELRRCARSIIRSRHRDIPDALLDDMIESDDNLRAEYEALIEKMRKPASAHIPRSGWLAGGVRVFEVTESPEGEMLWHGRRFAVVNDYTMNFVPNRPRHSIAPWALNFGGKS
jgi:hypothetical protein